MTNDNHHLPEDDDIVERASQALLAQQIPTGRMGEVLQAMATAVPPRRKVHRRFALVAAVVILAAAAAILWPIGSSPAAEFRQSIEHAAKAKTMTVRVTVIDDGPWGGTDVQKLYVRGLSNRYEKVNTGWLGAPPREQVPIYAATVNDLVEKRTLGVNFADRTFTVIELQITRPARDIIQSLREAQANSVRELGVETLNGVRARVYAVADVPLPGAEHQNRGADTRTEMKVWIGTWTNLPVRIHAEEPMGEGVRVTIYDEFAWDTTLPDKLFSLSPPEGFKEVPFVKNRHQPK